MNNKMIYFDNASTTFVNEDVLKSFNEVVLSYNGNPSSIHAYGAKANILLEKARNQILSLLGLTKTHELIFTSGATESNNLAIKGIAFKYQNRGKHLITSQIEHPSVLATFRQLEELFGFEVTYLKVDEKGIIDLNELKEAMRDDTILVSLMAVNNETGAVEPIKEAAEIVHQYPKCFFHSDIVQGIGKIDIPFNDLDLITFTSHKIHGLKGTGCLIKRKNISLRKQNVGGHQENGERGGTVDVAGAVAFSKALRITLEKQKEVKKHVQLLADYIVDYLNIYVLDGDDPYILNSDVSKFPYIINFSLINKKAAVVVEGLSRENIMVSSVSACNSKRENYSYVVKAMGRDEKLARNTIRVSLSEDNTMEEVEIFLQKLDKLVRGIRKNEI